MKSASGIRLFAADDGYEYLLGEVMGWSLLFKMVML
jgi:hypothetical protein